MRKVAVLGWFGHGNFGDELILEGVRELFKGWQVYSMDVPDFTLINRCDLFAVAGGEQIFSNYVYVQNPAYPRTVMKVANRLRLTLGWLRKVKVPKVLLGCGCNYQYETQLTNGCFNELKQFNYIGVRDTNALYKLRFHGLNAHYFPDLAYALPIQPMPALKKNLAVVFPTERLNCPAQESKRWLRKRLLRYDKTVFVPFGKTDNNDYATAEKLRRCGKNAEILNPEEVCLPKIAELICESRLVVAYRLHSLILAHILGAKYEFYPYHHKLRRVHETIKHSTPQQQQDTIKKEFNKLLEKGYASQYLHFSWIM